MRQYRHSRFDEEIKDAMMYYNANHPELSQAEKFNLIDAYILSLVHSYAYNNKYFFASNRYLADKCLVSQPTIQKSINKLIEHKLVTKSRTCIKGQPQRILLYDEAAIEEFLLWAAPLEINDENEDENWIIKPDLNKRGLFT